MSHSKYVRAEQHGEVLTVWPLFTFATFTEPDIVAEWAEIQKRLEHPDVKHVVVDLGEIPYFGSTVLEWMVHMWKRVRDKGGRLAACNASPIGREVLSVAHFEKIWGIFDSNEAALAWVKG